MQHDGTSIGRVVDVFSGTGTYDVMQVEVIEGETKGGKLLIPFAREIVPQVGGVLQPRLRCTRDARSLRRSNRILT